MLFNFRNSKAIQAIPKDGLRMGPVTMDELTESTTLVSRLGPQSWHFFVALQIETDWLSEPVSCWSNNTAYQRFHKFAHDLPITNDITERMIKRTSDYSNFGAKNEDDFQAILPELKKRKFFCCSFLRLWLT